MSWILHLETSTKVCSVALSSEGILRFTEEIADDQYAHGEQLTRLIEKVVHLAGIGMKQLDAVSVASGPGSYTGLRIGISTAKGLCYALGIPLILIDSLTALAERAAEQFPNKQIVPMIDARRMEVYTTVFAPNCEVLLPMRAMVLDEHSLSEFEPFVYFGDGAAKLQELWKQRDCVFDATLLSSAAGQVRLAFEKFNNKDFADLAYCEPIYLKDFGGKQL